jgi:uncharacterized membrane protein
MVPNHKVAQSALRGKPISDRLADVGSPVRRHDMTIGSRLWGGSRRGRRAVLYLFGTVGVTMAFNVPLNDRLDVLNAESVETARFWLIYLSEWMQWNHVRTITAVMATASFIVATRQL